MAGGSLTEVSSSVLKAHPMVFIFVIMVACVSFGFSWSVFAQNSDLSVLENRVDQNHSDVLKLNTKIDRGFLELSLNSIESEIYALERIVGSAEGTSRDAQRLDSLRVDRGNLVRKIADLPATI